MIWLLDAGHGGMALGEYLTPGKRSPDVRGGEGIYEGEFNREICFRIQQLCQLSEEHRIIMINPGPINIPLIRKKGQGGQCRVEFVNDLCNRFDREQVALISIHANAAGKSGWGPANGFVIFTAKNASKSSKMLSSIIASRMAKIPGLNRRLGGQLQANFTIIHKTSCPAILVECGFMTNIDDARLMASDDGINQIAMEIYNGMLEYDWRAQSEMDERKF